MQHDIEPLEPTLWFAQIENLLDRLTRPDSEPADALLRQGMYLAQLAPRPLRDTVGHSTDENLVDRMLECGANVSAFLAMLAPPLSYSLKQRDVGFYTATIRCGNSNCRGKGMSSTPEKALLIGWCQFLLDLKRPSQIATCRPQRILQAGQPRQLTEH